MPPRRTLGLLVVASALAAALAHHAALGLGLLGWDTYPLVLTSRVHSLADLAGTFTEELMDGRYTDGRFYRPVVNLSFALDESVWGLSAYGYHLTDLVLLAADGALVGALALALFGRRARWAAFVAALAFTLHPVQLELVPVAPRRADLLCLGFALASLLGRRPFASAAAALLAMGAKETGVVVLPLAAVLGVVEREATEGAGRAALLRALPAALAAGVYLIARTLVLGGLGGHAESSFGRVASAPELLLPYLARVLYPQPFVGSTTVASALVAAVAAALVATALALSTRAGEADRRRLRGALAFLAAWAALALGLSCVSGRVHDWYALWLVAPYALLLGALVERGVAAWRSGQRGVGTLASLAVPALLLATHVRFSGAFGGYADWHLADELHADALARCGRALDQARSGEVVVLEDFVPVLPTRADGSGVRSAALLSDYGLQAWIELTRPQRRARVGYVGAVEPSAAPDEVLVLLEPSAPPGR